MHTSLIFNFATVIVHQGCVINTYIYVPYLLLRFRSLYLRVTSGVYPMGSEVRHRGQLLFQIL